ncbi:predicted protein [Sparassis crispa]|uniref:M protein, serotype 2.1 n=1 Tax=Sparassis crispa TaxID=139825 RepID=A0A401G6R3_9APHY|nr:predicted protein [Sparassis crispa]GBE77844.1 predicted protein [Sparassis crispa]
MAATASSRAAPPASRRSSSISATPSSSIARGATARSAVSPRVSASLSSSVARRPSIKGTVSPVPAVNGETRESLSASLRQETEKKEHLLVQLQNKDQTIINLTAENANVSSALNAAESRLTELYADQNRMEEEMAARIEVVEKLRAQVRELEKEKRDIHRRYNEQTTTFEAERQAFYDNEQHLKSRIQSLTEARKQPLQPLPSSPSLVSINESEVEVVDEAPSEPPSKQDLNDPEQEPAEMTALRLELSTLSTSYASLQSTLVLLQTQLIDLKRVNNELQEENESYNILLRERTLNGQFDVLRMGGGNNVSEASESEAGEDDADGASLRSRNTTRSTLDPVDEIAEELEHEHGHDLEFEQVHEQGQEAGESEEPSRRRHGRKRASSSSHSPAPRGESLANLPITGPGLDLAAELGRAENKDMLEGRVTLENDRSILNGKGRKSRKSSNSETGRRMPPTDDPQQVNGLNDIDALRNEVKSLKDANKALSLYASKIIDRIISQEGFEHVLAVDYDKMSSPQTAGAAFTTFSNVHKSSKPPASQPQKKGRPQSAIFSFSSTSSGAHSVEPQTPAIERLTTFESLQTPRTASSPQSNSASPPTASTSTRSRRSLSFDWKSFTMFNSERKQEPSANLRPLTLRAGSSSVITGARKLETYEDEDDRRERERLNATMKLMGIEKPNTPAMQKSFSSPANPTSAVAPDANDRTPSSANTPATAIPPTPSSRFSFFRRTSSFTTTSDVSSIHSSLRGSPQPQPSGANTPNLTHEALEQVEAENTIAALDAHERQLSAEIAKGAGGGFTEIVRRTGDRRSSRKSGESASTVWSAGMSRGEDGDD